VNAKSARAQARVRLTLMRGGTSKGLYFHERALPPAGPARDALLLRLMGSPDVLQIDGLGGSRPITSKIAIIAQAARPDADVDYTFGQVDIGSPLVGWSGNCGNISSGVGPFAVDEGLVPAVDGTTVVRIHNTNTGRIIVAHVPVIDGAAAVEGDSAIPGVPGTGAGILMDWKGTVGGKTGRLLPSGRPLDTIVLESGRQIDASLVDVANPLAYVDAAAVGLSGSEQADEINDNAALLDLVREIRGKAAVLAGLCTDWRTAEVDSPGIPLLGIVAAPGGYVTMNGAKAEQADMDLRVRLMFMNRLHESLAGTASVNLAAASRIPGSVVARTVGTPTGPVLRAGHPSGIMPIHVDLAPGSSGPEPTFTVLGITRTARRLADCVAYVPRRYLPDTGDVAGDVAAR
jgi:2-methylaconitate cis-trans-isomerase PrpF